MKRPWIVAILCVLAVLLIGCSDAMSADDYGHVWRGAVLAYRKVDKNPDDPAATPEGNGDGTVQAHMQAASNISGKLRDIATSLRDLKVSDKYKELQDETYLFYRGQADEYAGYSEALATGDTDKIATAVDRLNSFAGEHQQKIALIIDKLGDPPSRFKDSWQTVLKDLPAKS